METLRCGLCACDDDNGLQVWGWCDLNPLKSHICLTVPLLLQLTFRGWIVARYSGLGGGHRKRSLEMLSFGFISLAVAIVSYFLRLNRNRAGIRAESCFVDPGSFQERSAGFPVEARGGRGERGLRPGDAWNEMLPGASFNSSPPRLKTASCSPGSVCTRVGVWLSGQ